MESNNNRAIIWSLIVIGLVAALLLWLFYGMSEPEVSEVSNQQENNVAQNEPVNNMTTDAEIEVALNEAQQELKALEARAETSDNYAEIRAELIETRNELEMAYADASVEAQQEWNQLEIAFDNLEEALRQGTGDVLDFFGQLFIAMEADVRVDEEESSMGQ